MDFTKMNFEFYKKCCLKFAEDSKDWFELDDGCFYTTDYDEGWLETGDNSSGGIYIDWCFHLNKEEIEKRALKEYVKFFAEYIDLVACEGWFEGDDGLEKLNEHLKEISHALSDID